MTRHTTIGAILLVLTAGCAKNNTTPTATVQAPPFQKARSLDGSFEGKVVGTPRSGGKFSKVRIGMSTKQVADLIGQPNDTNTHITGKSFIPFFFGGDTHRTETFYRNEGQLTFSPSHFASGINVLIAIQVNPNESGYAH